jgi:hypothetical protein
VSRLACKLGFYLLEITTYRMKVHMHGNPW